MEPQVLLVVMVGLGLSWAIQMVLAASQAKAFQLRVREMRAKGPTATGRYQRGHRSVAFCALTADDEGRVVDAAVLKGLTVFARPTPFPQVIGRRLEDLARSTTEDTPERAAAEAARALITEGREELDADSVEPTGGGL